MRRHQSARAAGPPELIDQWGAKQRNLVFPDTLVSGRAIDQFLWKGSPHPTFPQRIGAWIFGAVLIGQGVFFLTEGKTRGSTLLLVLSYGALLLGGKLFRNGFARGRTRPPHNNRSGPDGQREHR